MKLNLTLAELERLKNLETVMDYNIMAAETYNTYMEEFSPECSEKVKELCDKGVKVKDAFTQVFLSLTNEDNKKLIRRWELNKPEVMSSVPYDTNEYRCNVKPKPFKKGKWELFYDEYLPYEGFVYNNIDIESINFYREITPFAFFLKSFKFLSIKYNGETWMCATPHEINTMKDPIDNATGNVMTFGLGLGYYPYMCSLKNDVKKVTIVEKDLELIEIFKKHILPFFPHPEKIEIMPIDAFMVSEYLADGIYDSLFVDIWHTEGDGLPLYLKFNNLFKDFEKTKIDYWIEGSILALYRRALITLILEEGENGGSDEYYQEGDTFTDKLINALHFKLKEKEFNHLEEFFDFLSDESLKNLYIDVE